MERVRVGRLSRSNEILRVRSLRRSLLNFQRRKKEEKGDERRGN